VAPEEEVVTDEVGGLASDTSIGEGRQPADLDAGEGAVTEMASDDTEPGSSSDAVVEGPSGAPESDPAEGVASLDDPERDVVPGEEDAGPDSAATVADLAPDYTAGGHTAGDHTAEGRAAEGHAAEQTADSKLTERIEDGDLAGDDGVAGSLAVAVGETDPESAPEHDPESVAVGAGSGDSGVEAVVDVERREMEEAAAAAIQEALSAAAVAAPPREPSLDHALFDEILRATVRGDRVDYDLMRSSHASDLRVYLDQLAAVDDRALDWDEERLAFYINLYNATMFQAVLDRSSAGWTPAADSFAVFDDKIVRLKGREVSLNHLENEIVRKEFTEPRIHVALVCGARSCPQIRDRAYDPRTLDDMLNENMRAFLASGFRNRIDRRNRKLLLSQIFDWYAVDFGGKDQVAAYVDRYVSGDVSTYSVEFIEYQWDLNSTR